jgi:hypothetical protein
MKYKVFNITRRTFLFGNDQNDTFEYLNVESLNNKSFVNFLHLLDLIIEEFGTSNVHKTQLNDIMCISIIKLYRKDNVPLKELISVNCLLTNS